MQNKYDVNEWFVENEEDLYLKETIKIEGVMINYHKRAYVFDLNDMYIKKQYPNDVSDNISLPKNICDELVNILSNYSFSKKIVDEHSENFSGLYIYYKNNSKNSQKNDNCVMIFETNDDVPKEFLDIFKLLKNTYNEYAVNQSNVKKTDNIDSSKNPINSFGFTSSEITKENVMDYVKEINPKLLKKRKFYLFLSIILFIIDCFMMMFTIIPTIIIIGIVMFIALLNVNRRIKNIKNSILALKTSNNFMSYYSDLLSSMPNNLGIKCGKCAIYNKDGAILSGENICLVYVSQVKFLFIPIASQVMFGTVNGDLIPFGYRLSAKKQDFILDYMLKNNPNIMLGASSENIERFKQIKHK